MAKGRRPHSCSAGLPGPSATPSFQIECCSIATEGPYRTLESDLAKILFPQTLRIRDD
jgi:hypothetical protein